MKRLALSWAKPALRLLTPLSIASLCVLVSEALGADGSTSDWRPIYDLIMRWLNFGILAFVFIKYARRPLVDFFSGESEKVNAELNRVESEREAIKTELNRLTAEKADSQARLEQLKQKIIDQGEKEKQHIIESAVAESKILMESAGRKIDHQMLQTRNTLRAEMIDTAVAMAMDRLPQEVTPEDDRKWIERYLETTRQSTPQPDRTW